MFKRTLKLDNLLKRKSFFLFGPRSTGKTTLINQTLPNTKVYDLLDAEVYSALLKRPKLLEEENQQGDWVVIDEIQKLPLLLDEVHRLIERKKMIFLLTGSSARKLKRGSANLLAGRAWQASLFPLTFSEIPGFKLLQYLNRGGLPHIYQTPDYQEELRAYVNVYLREEIQGEALTRNVQAFAEFLDVIARSNGEEINYEGFSSDLQISPSTFKNYLGILEDTLIGFRLEGFTQTKKRKAISRSKFYLFDIGVVNTLCERGEIKLKSELFGEAFEHFIILEMRAYLSYQRKNLKMFYWRSTSQMEVDLVIDNQIAIEIKASTLVQDKHLKGLRALKEEQIIKDYIVVSLDDRERMTEDNIHIIPWSLFLKKLWNNELV